MLSPQLTPIPRLEPCRLCQSSQAVKVGEVDYWNLQTSNLVQCSDCKHIQLDPMLSDGALEKGCLAYYLKEVIETDLRTQERNLVRNYRRGILFGHQLKKKCIKPSHILEFGPGTGYFLAGLQSVFPESHVTVIDIVDEVLEKNRSDHGFTAIKGFPEKTILAADAQKFDLIIARDLIEHVQDLGAMVDNIKNLLNPGGYFHFITPNGYEDVWGHYRFWEDKKSPSELLINHVNYFEGQSLETYLTKKGFAKVTYYNYQFKDFFKGKGWKKSLKWSNPSRKLAPETYIQQRASAVTFDKKKALRAWYLQSKITLIPYLASLYHHSQFLTLNPQTNRGHEIHGLFKMN